MRWLAPLTALALLLAACVVEDQETSGGSGQRQTIEVPEGLRNPTPRATPTVDADQAARAIVCSVFADVLEEEAIEIEGLSTEFVAAAEVADLALVQLYYTILASRVPPYLDDGAQFMAECSQLSDDPSVARELRTLLGVLDSQWNQMVALCRQDLAPLGFTC